MTFLSTILMLLVCLPTLALAGAFGLQSLVGPDAGAYGVALHKLPKCASCFAYWDLRFQFDEDRADPDFAGESRWAVAVQIGRHRGDTPGTMRIKVWDNLTGTPVIQDVAVANPAEGVMVWFNQWDDPMTLEIWWAAPDADISLSHRLFTFPYLPGTQFKRGIAQVRLSTATAFAGVVQLYEEGNNFRGWTPIETQGGCQRLPDQPQNELHVTCRKPKAPPVAAR